MINDNQILLPVSSGKGCGYINTAGELIIDLRYDECFAFSEGLARVRIGDRNKWTMGCEYGKQGYIDAKGNMIISAEFPIAYSFSEGLAVVYIDSYRGGGGWVIPAPWEGGKAGYIDKTGKFIIKPQFDLADSFNNGIARVRKDGKYGYIDKAGEYFVLPHFDAAEPFFENLAAVNIGKRPSENRTVTRKGKIEIEKKYFFGKWGYINTKGDYIVEPKYIVASNFKEGMAFISLDEPSEPLNFEAKRGMRDLSRQLEDAFGTQKKHPKIFRFLSNLEADFVKYGYINTSGTTVIKPVFREAFEFSEGVAAVYKGILSPKCGYIDKTGKCKIDYEFNEGFSFKNGYARIIKEGKTGYINSDGEIIIKPKFEKADDFFEGFASVSDIRGGMYGYINKNGDYIIKPQFTSAGRFYNGLANVMIGQYKHDNWFKTYINKDGNILWKPFE